MRNTIFPVYVVIDFSGSMKERVSSGAPRIQVATSIIPALMDCMEEDASVADSLRVRVIGFNSGVMLRTELLDFYELEKWYKTENVTFYSRCDWNTAYASAFRALQKNINEDLDALSRSGKRYYRPLVYFLTDGKPEFEDAEKREQAYHELVNSKVDSHRNPVILCIGIGDEDMSILKRYGASRLGTKNGEYRPHNPAMTFIIKSGVKTGDGLKHLNRSVLSTIKNSLSQRQQTNVNPVKLEPDLRALKVYPTDSPLSRFFNVD